MMLVIIPFLVLGAPTPNPNGPTPMDWGEVGKKILDVLRDAKEIYYGETSRFISSMFN